MRKRRVWPVGMVLGMLAVDVAVSIYLFTRNNIWGKRDGKGKPKSREAYHDEENR